MPIRFGHVAYRVNDPQKLTRFYTELLGFRVSDWIGDRFSFLRCGPDHHTVNFARYEQEALHHIAFEVENVPLLHKACDFLAKNKIQLVWGPGRHIVGHNVAAYHRNADNIRVELFCEMDLMKDEALGYFEPRPWHEDRPQRPKVWPTDSGASARSAPSRAIPDPAFGGCSSGPYHGGSLRSSFGPRNRIGSRNQIPRCPLSPPSPSSAAPMSASRRYSTV
jgi:catechol 2,3-dioxygenase-like lactoylglutathione lyase family enzyme